MNDSLTISEINFVPVKPKDGLIGFVSFVYDRRIYMGNVSVFTRMPDAEKPTYRLSYPKNKIFRKSYFHPIDRQTQQFIESEVSRYIERLFAGDITGEGESDA